MSVSKPAESLKSLWIKFNRLPLIVIKKYNKHYLIPHRPSHPSMPYFNFGLNIVRQNSLKYNQYYSNQTLWEKFAEKIEQIRENKDFTEEQIQKLKDYEVKKNQYEKLKQQYKQKYIEPLKMIYVSSYTIFKSEFYQKKIQEGVVLYQKKKSNQNYKKVPPKNQEIPFQRQSLRQNFDQVNNLRVGEIWKNLPPQQKQLYKQKQMQIREKNQLRLSQFIQNHRVPQVKSYRAISRFISFESSQKSIKLTDPSLYQKYRELPEEQKNKYKEEALQMTKQSKQNYQNFLKKWNLSHEQLNHIIQISDSFRKLHKKESSKIRYREATKKKNKQLIKDQDESEKIDDYLDELQ